MPNRILKESINESRGLTCCTFFAQDLYKRLITYADDYGRFNADPQIMLARLYPRDLSIISDEDIVETLIELAGVEKIGFYTATPRKEIYGCFPNWGEHQRLRESKHKLPDPSDTTINDWYLRRYIPIEMKIAIVQRDTFKCRICNKHLTTSEDAKRFVKMGMGLYHIDHIVPCGQGGRATMENLQLTCPKCNQSRKKIFEVSEIFQFSANNDTMPQVAATGGENRPKGIESNPIQSESESESNPKGRAVSQPADSPPKQTYGQFKNILLTDEEMEKLKERFGEDKALDRIEEASESFRSHKNYPKQFTDHYATILSWARLDEKRNGGKNGIDKGHPEQTTAERIRNSLGRPLD